mgnify:FL=1|jgi:hypothetical protein
MKKGKGRVIGWTIELEWSNDVVEKYGDVDDICASEVDTYLTEVLEPERNGFRIMYARKHEEV